MKNKVENWVHKWATASGNNLYREIHAEINFLAEELFHDYQPSQGSASSFKSRLENWLLNIDDEKDRKRLFEILPHIFYVGNKEFNNLIRVAYNEIIAKWLIDTIDIKFDDLSQAKQLVNDGLKECWICPITDSFNINTFFHVNNIPNNGWNEWRPQWYTIDRGNDLWNTYHNYIVKNKIKKLVLLEDFVGSGSQVGGVVDFVLKKALDLDVLLVPLINCPVGHKTFTKLQGKHDRLTYHPVLKPSGNCFVTRIKATGEPVEFNDFRDLIERYYLHVSNGVAEGAAKPYSPYGFRDTGGLIVMHTNTPDNTIPAIHWNSDTWNSIFPRHSRN